MSNRFGRLGWFFGIIAGALLGVLFAPRKGKDLRDRMKADRKKGKLGIAPLGDDMRMIGQEMARIAKDIYYSEKVQDLVEMGRKKVKDLSGDLVGDIHDFHAKRIVPLESAVEDGKKTVKRAGREWSSLRNKFKKSAKIGKKAVGDIKATLKRKKD